ncbi:Aldehyde/histidinol dehydrogenase [Phakopsora pachyrhizi]|uniref:aldehyde dehydrogenase (NAD(+)) n=1 Tax=Phakopsora pachyrhizi TaxID=170000 RepID=A0AAV0AHT2_PHAPC|nr:Aldehyde/histidinol dehydrogenase [Phakopsora pachyrhizi]
MLRLLRRMSSSISTSHLPPQSCLSGIAARKSFATSLDQPVEPILKKLGLLPCHGNETIPGLYDGEWKQGRGQVLVSVDPATGKPLGPRVSTADRDQTIEIISSTRDAFNVWKKVPAPRRGEILKEINDRLIESKDSLAALITFEMGKIKSESLGEVEEAVQIFDYALGLSRIFGGKVISSERVSHIIQEVPNPLGTVGVISAFNFPCAVYSWNFALSFITGNSTIWKPSPTTPLTAIAMTKIISSVLERHNLPGSIASLVCGGAETGDQLVNDKRIDLLSFTGSEHVGKIVGEKVQARFGKVLLELGGNNALVVMPSASLDLALRATVFGAIGTAGQRCTTTRRLFLHESIAERFLDSLVKSYQQVDKRFGHGLESSTLICALHTNQAVRNYLDCIEKCKSLGGKIVHGGKRIEETQFVQPTIVDWGNRLRKPDEVPEVVRTEVFAPILHVGTFQKLEQAVEMTNSVDQALSSSLFSRDIGDVFYWTGSSGSRCGIVNVNAGTSGAEIGAGFGGNFHTGWGRESGGDAWKQYCRWSSCTINFSDEMPLAQGIEFV